MKKEKYICCIIDGMDQSKLLLPCLIQTAKAYAGAWRLKTHLTGTCRSVMIIYQGAGQACIKGLYNYFFVDLPGY